MHSYRVSPDVGRPIKPGSEGAPWFDFLGLQSSGHGPRKTRVFSTSIGHNNATVDDPRYLDLVVRGLLWAAGKLGADGRPAAGYGPKG